MENDRHDGSSESAKQASAGYQLPAVAWAMGTAESEHAPAAAPDVQPEAMPTLVQPAVGATGQAPAVPVAAEAVAGVETVIEATPEVGVEEVAKPGRISRPMLAAAATAGVVLMGLPLLLVNFGGGGPHRGPGTPAGPPPAGYSQPGGGDGFVPGFDQHGDTTGPATMAAGAPGAQLPSAPAAPQQGAPAGGNPPSQGHPGGTGGAGHPGGTGGTGGGGTGGGSGGGSGGSTNGGGTTPQQPSAPAPVTYASVAGPWCSNSGTGFKQYGWFDQGDAGWKSYSSGGWGDDNCRGSFSAVPMSGSATSDDSGNSVMWTFDTGAVSHGSCQISVYIPADGDIKAVGGNPTYYTVQSEFSPNSGTIGSFTIAQVDHRGEWVGAGGFPVNNGKIAVMLHTRGKDFIGNGTKTYAHHAADAVKVNCTA